MKVHVQQWLVELVCLLIKFLLGELFVLELL
ncbi:hypothetical protein PAV_2c03080 [Paenibacillus alvei DSM 29]|nr:hypothetical protein PAV_2c03080 [Paenibacillus alvei DSM 29]